MLDKGFVNEPKVHPVQENDSGTFDICSLTAEVILGGGLLKLRWLRSRVFTTVSMRSLPPCRFLLWDLLLERSDLLLWVWNTGAGTQVGC